MERSKLYARSEWLSIAEYRVCCASSLFRKCCEFPLQWTKSDREKPSWPSDIVEENVVLESLKARQNMRLVFVDLTHSSCEYENGEEVKEYRLVYEPDPSHAFIDASTGKDLFGPDHYKLPPTVAVEITKNIAGKMLYSICLTGIKKVLQK